MSELGPMYDELEASELVSWLNRACARLQRLYSELKSRLESDAHTPDYGYDLLVAADTLPYIGDLRPFLKRVDD